MELLTTKLLHCFCLDSLRNTHVLFDESDSLGDAAADNVFRPSPLNVLKLVTGPSMAPLVSAMNCSHTVFSRRSTSFLESRRCSWTAGAECRMNSSRALLLFIERMSDLTTRLSFVIQSTQQFLFMSSCIYIDTCD